MDCTRECAQTFRTQHQTQKLVAARETIALPSSALIATQFSCVDDRRSGVLPFA
jgi:hypothetical protein